MAIEVLVVDEEEIRKAWGEPSEAEMMLHVRLTNTRDNPRKDKDG
jgi:hypothetical protein